MSSFLIMLLFSCALLSAQTSTAPAYKVKAVFLFNCTRFIDWPENSFSSPDAPFVIGVVGSNPFEDFLEQSVAGERLGNHPIIIQQYKNVHDNFNCQVLFINYSDESKIREIISSISDKSILTVGDSPFFDKLGGIVQFYTEKDKIRLLINTEAAKTARLKISSKLLSVAKTN